MQKYSHFIWSLVVYVLAASFMFGGQKPAAASPANYQPTAADARLEASLQASDTGRVRVLVQLDLPIQPEGRLRSAEAVDAQHRAIETAQQSVMRASQQLAGVTYLSHFQTMPLLVMEVDAAGLIALQNRPDVAHIVEDELSAVSSTPALESSLAIIHSDAFHTAGYDGAGGVVAVLDTGVDRDHIAFNFGGSRIVAEGCFSTESDSYGGVYSVCPNRAEASTGIGSGDDCIDAILALGMTLAATDCKHGTHTAGIIGANDGASLVGVAPGVGLIPIQVFSAFAESDRMLSFTSDQIHGLEYVISLAAEHNITAVNLSLGGTYHPDACDYDARRQAILTLQSLGIATIIAAGNEGFHDGVGRPGCISEAITVGATNDNDAIAVYSNISSQIDILAPGTSIESTYPGNGTGILSGTSMSAPVVAGTFALLRQIKPQFSIAEKLAVLQETGVPVDDRRVGGTMTSMKRIDLAAALVELSGKIHLSIEGNSVFFSHLPEAITLNLLNDSDTIASGLVVSATVPSHLTLDPASVSNGGTADGGSIIWKNLTLGIGEKMALTFEVTGFEAAVGQDLSVSAHAIDSAQRQDEATHAVVMRPILACSRYEHFEDGLPTLEDGWLFNAGDFGQIRVTDSDQVRGTHSFLLEESEQDGKSHLVSADLALNMIDANARLLDFQWHGHGIYTFDEDTGLFASADRGATWTKIKSPAFKDGWEHVKIDLSDLDDFTADGIIFFSFRFYGDGAINTERTNLSSGLFIDELQVNCGDQLVWDGEAGSAAWSDPLNWSPNLRPNGNSVLFEAGSPPASEVDRPHEFMIGDLIIDQNWGGTLTQTAPLMVTGDYLQQSGLVIINADRPLSVSGSLVFSDGALRQTKTIDGTSKPFLEVRDPAGTAIRFGGYTLHTAEAGTVLNDVTVTIAGPNWGETYCANVAEASASGVHRCFDISAPASAPLTARIWLDDIGFALGELESADPILEFANAVTSPHGRAPEEAPSLKMLTFNGGAWQEIDKLTLGSNSGRPYAQVTLDQPGPIIAQQVERVPTAVTLAGIGSSAGSDSANQMGWGLLLLLLTAGAVAQQAKKKTPGLLKSLGSDDAKIN